MGLKLSRTDMDTLFKDSDVNGDGTVDHFEIVMKLMPLIEAKQLEKDIDDNLHTVDQKNSGSISKADFRKVAKKFKMSDADLKDIFADLRGPKMISYAVTAASRKKECRSFRDRKGQVFSFPSENWTARNLKIDSSWTRFLVDLKIQFFYWSVSKLNINILGEAPRLNTLFSTSQMGSWKNLSVSKKIAFFPTGGLAKFASLFFCRKCVIF